MAGVWTVAAGGKREVQVSLVEKEGRGSSTWLGKWRQG